MAGSCGITRREAPRRSGRSSHARSRRSAAWPVARSGRRARRDLPAPTVSADRAGRHIRLCPRSRPSRVIRCRCSGSTALDARAGPRSASRSVAPRRSPCLTRVAAGIATTLSWPGWMLRSDAESRLHDVRRSSTACPQAPRRRWRDDDRCVVADYTRTIAQAPARRRVVLAARTIPLPGPILAARSRPLPRAPRRALGRAWPTTRGISCVPRARLPDLESLARAAGRLARPACTQRAAARNVVRCARRACTSCPGEWAR